jgi:hypothetical protein
VTEVSVSLGFRLSGDCCREVAVEETSRFGGVVLSRIHPHIATTAKITTTRAVFNSV